MTLATPVWLAVVIELGELGLTLYRIRWADPLDGTRRPWRLMGIAMTFGSGLLLAASALRVSGPEFVFNALALTMMSLGASQFGFALYYIRPMAERSPRPYLTGSWKALAGLSFASVAGAFVLLFPIWAPFVRN